MYIKTRNSPLIDTVVYGNNQASRHVSHGLADWRAQRVSVWLNYRLQEYFSSIGIDGLMVGTALLDGLRPRGKTRSEVAQVIIRPWP